MQQSVTLIIRGKFPSFNDFLNAGRTNRYKQAAMKKEETERVAWECKVQKIPKFDCKIGLYYNFFSADARRDEDSFLLGCKFVADGLVMAGVIPNDTRRYLHIKRINFWPPGGEDKTEVTIMKL